MKGEPQMTYTTATLDLCGDCYYTAHVGWDMTMTGRPLPEPAPLSLVPDNALVGYPVTDPATGMHSEAHYGKRPCEGCGITLEGDRFTCNVTYT